MAEVLLQIIAASVVLGTLLAAAAGSLWNYFGARRGAADPWPSWTSPALALGVAALTVGLSANFFGWQPLSPRTGSHWYLWAVIGAAGVALAMRALAGAPELARRSALVVAGAGAVALVLQNHLKSNLAGSLPLLLIGAVLIGSAASLLEKATARASGLAPVLHLLGATTATAIALLSTGSLQLGQQGIMLAAFIGPWLVAALLRPALRLGGGFPTVIVLAAGALIAQGAVFSDLPRASAVLLLLAFAAGALVDAPRLQALPPLKRAVLGLAPAVVLCVAAVGIGLVYGQPQSESSSSADESNYYEAYKNAPAPSK